MAEERHNPMQCTEFEALLTEAIDGTLAAPEMERARAHASACDLCGPLFALAQEGRTMLRGLPEMEPPAYLTQKILNVTSELRAAAKPQRAKAPTAGGWLGLRPIFTAAMQPRFGMSFAMAFFSLTLLLNVTGVKVGDLRYVDLRPSAMKQNVVKSYYETTGRAQKYYENLRFVYQVQSTLRDLRNATTSQDEDKPQTQQQQQKKQPRQQDGNTSEQPQEKNERYSLDRPAIQLASAPVPDIRFRNDRRTA